MNTSKNKQKNNKMTIGQTFKFIITGKKPENLSSQEYEEDEEQLIEENETKETAEEYQEYEEEEFELDEELKPIPKKSKAQAQFEKDTGMTLKKAETLLKKWAKNGEKEKFQKGALLIGKYFPHHFSQKFVQKKKPEKKSEKNIKTSQKTKQPKKSEKSEKSSPSIFSREEGLMSKESLKNIAKNPLGAVGVSFSAEEGLPDENEIEDDERVFAAISYIPFVCLFVILTQKKSQFSQFHAWQAFAFLVIMMGLSPFGFFFSWFPFVPTLIFLTTLFVFVSSVFAGGTALRGRYINLPFVSGFAKTLSGRN